MCCIKLLLVITKRMEQVIHNAMSRADMIITTGGLGPHVVILLKILS